MNIQGKVLEAASQWRARARNFAEDAAQSASERARSTTRRLSTIRQSLTVLSEAGLELSQVARRHASRFVKQNSPLWSAARKDVSKLARNTLATLAQGTPASSRKPAKTRAAARKRTARAA